MACRVSMRLSTSWKFDSSDKNSWHQRAESRAYRPQVLSPTVRDGNHNIRLVRGIEVIIVNMIPQ